MGDDELEQTLRAEFNADERSFLLQLRCDLRWDVEAFRRVTSAMFAYVRARDPEADIPRWVAEGFWYLGWYVESWSQHPNFPRPLRTEYYDAAYERLSGLAYWLFVGESMYTSEEFFERPLPWEPSSGAEGLISGERYGWQPQLRHTPPTQYWPPMNASSHVQLAATLASHALPTRGRSAGHPGGFLMHNQASSPAALSAQPQTWDWS
jgi:hypothetical protein